GDRRAEAANLTNIASVYAATARPDSALAVLDSAIVVFATVRMHVGSDASAVAYAEQQGGPIDLWVRTWLAVGPNESALAAAERGRAQGLRDLLARRGGAAGPEPTDMLWSRDTVAGADPRAEAGHEPEPL